MHSSRMRTGHPLTVCCSLLLRGGSAWSWGGLGGLVLGGPGGSASSGGGWSAWSGGFSLVPGGSAWPRGVLHAGRGLTGPGGFSLVPGGSPETPPVDRITDTCKNITLATTSLRPVKRILRGLNSQSTDYQSATITIAPKSQL